MIKPEDLTDEELKAVARYINETCGYAITDALIYQYNADLKECFGEFEESDRKDEVKNYVKACNYFTCYDNGASDWLKGKY